MDEKERLDQLLPIGSVVLLKEAKKKLMILGVMQLQKERVFEYMGVLYPEGYAGPKTCFLFNQEDIEEIVWKGYEDKERELFLEFLKKAYETGNSVLTRSRSGE